MMINWFLSIMVHKKLMTLEEAEHFAQSLITKTYPQDFTSAHRVMEEIWSDLKK